MGTKVGQSERFGVEDEKSEDAVALGEVSDGGYLIRRETDVDELRQAGSYTIAFPDRVNLSTTNEGPKKLETPIAVHPAAWVQPRGTLPGMMSWTTYRRRYSRHRPAMTRATLLRFAASVSVVALTAVACHGSNPAKHPSAYRSPAASARSALLAATVTTATSPLGQILVDGGGRTLYLFQHDTGHGSTCYGACAASWPPLLNQGGPEAGTGISAVRLGTTARIDGTTQVTFEGHPLCYYVADTKPGDTTGQSLDQFGAKWYVLSSNGEAMTPAPSGASAAAVSVKLSEFKVGLASSTLNPGQVTLSIRNAGTIPHELLVFRSDLDPNQYPLENGNINEAGPGLTKVSDGDNLDPGSSQLRTVDLRTPGKYLFVCNLPGHFKAGMYAVVSVP
jgi:predicted lipoprotein with Yx(FWY)xxD motif/uncharacterized cupredoxin-like copper-binding protein